MFESEVNNAVKNIQKHKIVRYTFQNIRREIHLFIKRKLFVSV